MAYPRRLKLKKMILALVCLAFAGSAAAEEPTTSEVALPVFDPPACLVSIITPEELNTITRSGGSYAPLPSETVLRLLFNGQLVVMNKALLEEPSFHEFLIDHYKRCLGEQ